MLGGTGLGTGVCVWTGCAGELGEICAESQETPPARIENATKDRRQKPKGENFTNESVLPSRATCQRKGTGAVIRNQDHESWIRDGSHPAADNSPGGPGLLAHSSRSFLFKALLHKQ